MSDKIQQTHLERGAYVYVRQSSMTQVRNRLESQDRQYGLADRARELGFSSAHVIDEDLGRSGSGAMERPGFAKLLAAVCAGSVGAVFALDASRLARNNRDWHHLIDLCAMTQTLVIDYDGTYDPTLLNDRLVLGLKGTMSEFEMNLLRQRALESLRHKVRRGKVLTQVAIGFVRTEDDGIEMTPDLQIQEAIRGIFTKFLELGSVRQVLLWYHAEKIPLPTFQHGTGNRTVAWRLPVYARLFNTLTNPVYAGAFVYGRRSRKTKIVDGRARKVATSLKGAEECEVFIRDHHQGYITWEEFTDIQSRIRNNAAMQGRMGRTGTGAAKAGKGLLSGLLRCGKCGRSLNTKYGGPSSNPRYECPGQRGRYLGRKCLSLGGLTLDRAVSAEVLSALQPVGIEAALDAWDRRQETENQKQQGIRMALDKASYEANRTQRQYDATDPANRLVAGELERRWNEALERVTGLETRLAMMKESATVLTEEHRRRLMELGSDLDLTWNHPQCPTHLKKRILRTVLREIVVTEDEDPTSVLLTLHWQGGGHTYLAATRRTQGQHENGNDRAVVELVAELATVCNDQGIVAILNRLGYKTGAGNTWMESRVQHLRHTNQIPACAPVSDRPWLTMALAAEELKVSPMVVRKLIGNKTLPARQIIKHAPWVIERKDLQLPAVRRAAWFIHQGQRVPRIANDDSQSSLFLDSSEV
jgi:DNA invertase Pin-like site-specific DNA recombinase